MNARSIVLGKLAALALFVALGGCVVAPGDADPDFIPLFNAKDLTGWSGDPRLWRVVDGAIVGSTDGAPIERNSFLLCETEFSDFVLRVSVKLRNHNSGVQFRSAPGPGFAAVGYQADVAEELYFGMLYEEGGRGFMEYWNAMLDEERSAVAGLARSGEWNQFEITCIGDRIKLALNGVTTCDIRDPAGARRGVIGLQLHAGAAMMVSFKDIMIQDLSPPARPVRDLEDSG